MGGHPQPLSDAGPWKRNLAVCVVGSFTTIIGMTLLLPFLPLYVEELGVSDHAAIVEWSGAAYGVTFFAAAIVARSDARRRHQRLLRIGG